MTPQELIRRIPDPFPDGDRYEGLPNLLATSAQFRELCYQVAAIMVFGNKTLRVSFVTTLELMCEHANDYESGIVDGLEFIPDEEGGAE